MIYIYNDYGGTHTTSLAAAYHLNKLPLNRKLTKDEILGTQYFNKLQTSDMGKLIFHGVDDEGNPVYTVGRGSSKAVIPSLKDMYAILQDRFHFTESIVFSNTSHSVPLAMTIGGLLSRRLRIHFLGVPLLVLGAKQCCLDIRRLVSYTKQFKTSKSGSILDLDNKNVPSHVIEEK